MPERGGSPDRVAVRYKTGECMRNRSIALTVTFLSVVFSVLGTVRVAEGQYIQIERVSKSSAGLQADSSSATPSLSADGRFAAFSSIATNLVTGDTNAARDVFLFDRQTGLVVRASLSSNGIQGDGDSESPATSQDGKFTAYVSSAANLVTGDTNGVADIFVFERDANLTTRVSVSSAALQADGASAQPVISGDGRYVVFRSEATNLVTGDTNAVSDIFLHDRQTGATTLLSSGLSALPADGASTTPDISSDGRYVVFASAASNLVIGDTNAVSDVFLVDLAGVTLTRISNGLMALQADGASRDASISGDGSVVAFVSAATNIVIGDTNGSDDVFVYLVGSGALTRESVSSLSIQKDDAAIDRPVLSGDGRYVAYASAASNLVTGDSNEKTDLFVRDRSAATTTRVSVSSSGAQLQADSVAPALSDSAQRIAFSSISSALVTGDSNGATDIFVTNLECPLSLVVSPESDVDLDGTRDCSDGCGEDPAKSAPLVCGCGVADSDGDGDGALDCIEACPLDPLKTAAGACGCGISDIDSSGNGVADCLDPTALTVPRPPRVRINVRNAKITLPADFKGVTYRVVLRQDGRVVATKSSTRNVVYFKNLNRGSYKVRYQVSLQGVVSKQSETRRVKIAR